MKRFLCTLYVAFYKLQGIREALYVFGPYDNPTMLVALLRPQYPLGFCQIFKLGFLR